MEATTNSEGYAEFETGDDYDDLDAAQVKIYVEGQEFGPYSLQEDYTVTVESDDDEEEE